ncbi:MAG: hypothetical protein IIZ04_00650 [Aeriscardovia sp.]|nr:hypothetical protein [Aeriscardovia sp.]
MNLTSICKTIALLAPFLTGIVGLGGLVFKVWTYEQKNKKEGEEMPLPVENPDLITVCSKLDAISTEQKCLAQTTDNICAVLRSFGNRLDNLDARFGSIDQRIARLEEKVNEEAKNGK